jgi:tRNA 2-thiouridine synthesizing protein A
MAECFLDARGLKCPLPVMMTAKLLRALPEGALARVLATDPGAPLDFVDLCASQGHQLLESRETDGAFEFVIRAGARAPHSEDANVG